MHFDLDYPISLTGLAASALDVEGKPARSVASLACLGHARKQLPDGCE